MKNIGFYLNISVLIFALQIIPVSYSVASEISGVSRIGSYQADGSYIWNYSLVVSTDDTPFKEVEIRCVEPDKFPFRTEGFPQRFSINVNRSKTVTFKVTVPASCIKESANLQTYGLKVATYDNGTTLYDSKTIAVRGPLPGHPRLFVRTSEREAIRRKISHPLMSEVKAAFDKQLAFETDGSTADERPSEQVRQKMEALALEYLMYGESKKQSGEKAVQIALNYLSSIYNTTGYWGNVYAYEAIIGASMVYDWCYDLMDAGQKKALNREMRRVCTIAEYSYPGRTPKDYFSGHYGEHAPTVFLAMGIAAFDEDAEMFDFEYSEQINHFIPSRNPMYKAGTHHQGSQYMHSRYVHELMQAFMLGKIGVHLYDPRISSLSYRGVYLWIPQRNDMDGMPDGDTHIDLYMGRQNYFLSATMSHDPFLQNVATRFLPHQLNESARLFIWYDPAIPSESLDKLTLSRFFPSPSGIMMARTGWDMDKKGYDSNVMVVQMNMKEYNSRNHDHSDAGHFSIYYKGHLALDAGIYQGEDPGNGWGKTNFVNYYTRTVAHNSLLILDPNEPKPYGANGTQAEARDGGQFVANPGPWRDSRDMFGAGKAAQVLAHDIAPGVAPDYTYMKGDMTRAYIVPPYISKTYPAKVDTVRRSFVFLNHHSGTIPGSLIVLDRVVSTDASFRKSWLLHSQNEPEIKGQTVAFSSTQGGRNGKLHTTILLPEPANTVIEKTGGPGKEYWVDGRNWGTVTQEDAGRWRIELGFAKPALSDNYLTVMQAMDAVHSPAPCKAIKTFSVAKDYVAVEIADRIVAQKITLGTNENDIHFTAGNKNKTYHVLITDLKAGKWTVSSPSGIKETVVEKSAGTIYFESKGGNFYVSH